MNIIGIYPGAFQPPIKGHFKAYEFLKKVTGTNTFVATSDVVELPMSPLNFYEKQQIWTKHGVPIDKVVQVKNPQKAVEITQKFGPDRTISIFAMSFQEASSVFKSSNGYFIPFKGMPQSTEPLSKHSYVLIIPDEFLFSNKSINASTIRQAFSSKKISGDQKKLFFKKIFGWYDISLYDLISKKFAEAATVKEHLSESSIMVLRRFLKPFIKEVLGQLSQPQGIGTAPSSVTSTIPQLPDPADLEKQKRDAEKARDLQLKQKTIELQTAKKQQDYQKQQMDQSNRFTIPNLNKDIQNLKASN